MTRRPFLALFSQDVNLENRVYLSHVALRARTAHEIARKFQKSMTMLEKQLNAPKKSMVSEHPIDV